MTVKRILILGGYGNFGRRITENLAGLKGVTVIVAGRNSERSEALCHSFSDHAKAELQAAKIDIYHPQFIEQLRSLQPDLVIHTGGPFQGQDYRVPKACIELGSHYIDLADDRRYVCDIRKLSAQATASNVLLVSGASSVPGLSSTVIDHYRHHFAQLDDIDIAIAPGNRGDRGEATVRGILSYTGHAFPVYQKGLWQQQYGWMSPRKLPFDGVIGERWLANVDVPDLELFPERYAPVQSVRFQAGLELPWLHLSMVGMAWLSKVGLVKDWSRYTSLIFKSSELLKRLGTDIGGMQIRLSGQGENGQPKKITWTLFAENNVGPYIPTLSAIILAKKLVASELNTTGAMACLGLYTLQDFDDEAKRWGIHHQEQIADG